ncbi:MAG TPA: hypothetical protein DCO71_01715 [Gammaproteobacteria bacterium]|nr:hypothetical protein [Gammaproteobacteria bacterium]
MVMDSTLISALLVLLLGLIAFVLFTWSNTRGAREHTENILQQQRLVRTSPDAHRLSQAMHLLRPSVRLGFDYLIKQEDGKLPYIAEWDTGGSMPTQAELDDALKKVAAIDCTGYAAMRRSEYPGIEEQLDAAFKARHGDTAEQDALDNRIQQTKEKYPKSDDAL